jgi:hypothetical protein
VTRHRSDRRSAHAVPNAPLRLEISAGTFAWPGVRIDGRGFQVGMAERRRDQRDRWTIVDGVACVRMPVILPDYAEYLVALL